MGTLWRTQHGKTSWMWSCPVLKTTHHRKKTSIWFCLCTIWDSLGKISGNNFGIPMLISILYLPVWLTNFLEFFVHFISKLRLTSFQTPYDLDNHFNLIFQWCRWLCFGVFDTIFSYAEYQYPQNPGSSTDVNEEKTSPEKGSSSNCHYHSWHFMLPISYNILNKEICVFTLVESFTDGNLPSFGEIAQWMINFAF